MHILMDMAMPVGVCWVCEGMGGYVRVCEGMSVTVDN